MKLKAPPGAGDPCVAGVNIAPRNGVYEVEAEIGALLMECFGFVELELAAPQAPKGQPQCGVAKPRRGTRKTRKQTMAASDLAALGDVKTWLAGSSGIGSSDDALIGRLITDVSGAIAAYLGRPALTPHIYSERLDGKGKTRMFLRHYPALQVSALVIDNVALAQAVAPAAGASFSKGYLLEPWDGFPPGRQNVVVTYNAGYAVESESQTVPATPGPYNVTAAAPFGPWASDQGVTYSNGTPLVAVSGAPSAGQYNVSAGAYTFSAADACASLQVSYGFLPAAINNACIEWVAERYRYRGRIGQSAQTVQGQMTSAYSLKDMPDFVRASLDPYRAVVGI
jgi:hypothetical protein